MTSPGYTLPKNKWMDGPYCQHYIEKELIAQGVSSALQLITASYRHSQVGVECNLMSVQKRLKL